MCKKKPDEITDCDPMRVVADILAVMSLDEVREIVREIEEIIPPEA